MKKGVGYFGFLFVILLSNKTGEALVQFRGISLLFWQFFLKKSEQFNKKASINDKVLAFSHPPPFFFAPLSKKEKRVAKKRVKLQQKKRRQLRSNRSRRPRDVRESI